MRLKKIVFFFERMRATTFFMLGPYLYRIQCINMRMRVAGKALLKKILIGSDTAAENDFPESGVFVGPRPELTTSWCSNVVSILHESNINVDSVERYHWFSEVRETSFDDLTEVCIAADKILEYFETYEPKQLVPDEVVLNIETYARMHGLNFDATDLEFYRRLFGDRSPTAAELHDLANSNSEHSRHHLFRAKFRFNSPVYGPSITSQSMMDIVQSTLTGRAKQNSLVAFCDNASAIKGYQVKILVPDSQSYSRPGALRLLDVTNHISFTAETHNFPTGIAPFQGATTGTGGRIRDTQAIGKGGTFVAGTCGYCVGPIPIDKARFDRISPIDMLLRASDGASDYGNKIGEPVIQGFCRSFGDEQYEWTKPIMFSGGIGHVTEEHLRKEKPVNGWKIVRVGGPTYRLGIGGGAASSTTQAADSEGAALRCAVQRGDAQMENRMDAWLRACINLGALNPIRSIHDQGAGGMANVTKEILDGVGGVVNLKSVTLGDQSLSDAEIWVSESQEQITTLIDPRDIEMVKNIAFRERIHLDVIGEVCDSGRIIVTSASDFQKKVVDLPLSSITPPPKIYDISGSNLHSAVGFDSTLTTLTTNDDKIISIMRDINVGSKRFLTNKVDRSVSGLIAQQQCVGPLQTPLADVAVIANSFFDYTGAATAIGERTIIDNCIVGSDVNIVWSIYEMLTNLMWAAVTDIRDIKCSGNWMWPASSVEEKDRMFLAANTVSKTLKELGIAIDGGKDSVSMSARLRSGEIVNSPPTFVISGYVACEDIRLTIRPGLQREGSYLLYISIENSALSVSSNAIMVHMFETTQRLIRERVILSGHDVSDGGIIACVSEMCFAGEGYGFSAIHNVDYFAVCPAIVIEIPPDQISYVIDLYQVAPGCVIGKVTSKPIIIFHDNVEICISELRGHWESAATMLEQRQTAPHFAQQEHDFYISHHQKVNEIVWPVSDEVWSTLAPSFMPSPVRVAVIRGEGTNGHREMSAALFSAGFEVHDVTTSDITDGRLTSLDSYQGIVFPGGFTYSDVLGSAAGWQAVLECNNRAQSMIREFRARQDTFVLGENHKSEFFKLTLCLGVCNGCQLLSRLGWIDAKLGELRLS